MGFRRLFSADQRISRKRYWLLILIFFVLLWVSFLIPGAIAFLIDKLGKNSGFLKNLPGIIWFIQLIPLGLYFRGVIAGRLNDLNWTGCRFHILWFIPGLGWLIALTLLGIMPSKLELNEEVVFDELEKSKTSNDDQL